MSAASASNIRNRPAVETNIPISATSATFEKNRNESPHSCAISNLLTPSCVMNPTTGDQMKNCVAYCPTLNRNNLVKFVPNSNINRNSPSVSLGAWSNNTLNDPNSNNIRNNFKVVTFTDTDNNKISCSYINAGSDNCKTSDSFGCKAFCPKPSGNSFMIEQKCKSSPDRCNVSDLTWVKI